MKTITINVSEPVYADFQRHAKEQDRPTSELIRESMEAYREKKIRPRRTLRDLRPASVGEVIQPWTGRSELVDDLLDSRARH
tara:strand:- start:167 stop:412 length:246 start_codon:yes stop_codon:yes gene_type:complete